MVTSPACSASPSSASPTRLDSTLYDTHDDADTVLRALWLMNKHAFAFSRVDFCDFRCLCGHDEHGAHARGWQVRKVLTGGRIHVVFFFSHNTRFHTFNPSPSDITHPYLLSCELSWRIVFVVGFLILQWLGVGWLMLKEHGRHILWNSCVALQHLYL